MSRQIKTGETIRLNHSTRRRFLRLLGIGTVSVAGLQTALKSAYGKEPEGVPLTLTTDKQGRPDEVKIIEEERYNLMQKYKEFSKNIGDDEKVKGITLKQRSESRTDLRIEVTVVEPDADIHVDEESVYELEKDIKSHEPARLPVEIKRKVVKSDGDACGDRGDDHTPLEGGLGISTAPYTTSGTLGLVCYGDGTDTDDTVLITADHVMEGSSNMYQVNSDPVGSFVSRSQDEDITAYEFNSGSGASPEHGGIEDTLDVTGLWTWDGIMEETIRDTIDCTLSGRTSCTEDNMVVGVNSGGERAEHQVNMDNRNAQGGDSGGPWIDDNGNLVAFHSGRVYIEDPVFGVVLDEWDAGVAAAEALNAVNSQLSP